MEAKERIICALDVDNAFRGLQLVSLLKDHVGAFKVGLELVTATGVQIFEKLKEAGADKIFYDAKLHDIPNTIQGAMRGVSRLGIWSVTVHTTGGKAMLEAAVEAAKSGAVTNGLPRPKIFGVTVLTSIGEDTLRDELGVSRAMGEHVTRLALMAYEAGCDGVIASPLEVECIREAIPSREFLIVTPGVRPAGGDKEDQARVVTPGEAISKGADYLVIGRPIVASLDPVAAAKQIALEIEAA